MDELRFSVVVPAYQAAAVIGQCVRSLQQQTVVREEYEVIVADDGSTDATAAIAREAGADRVLTIAHGGPAVARNVGIAAARGEIILFTDADCEPLTDWLAEMVRPFADPEVMGVKGVYRTRQREVIARLAQCEFEERYDLLERTQKIDFVDSYAAAFRAKALRESGGFDPAFTQANNEDVDLSYRLARQGYTLLFNRRAIVYHHHPARWRAYLRLKARRGYWRMMVYRLHPGKALHDSYTPQLLKAQVILVYGCLALGAGALVRPALGWAAGAALGALGLSALPFARLAAHRDAGVAVWAPLFVWARAGAFAVGVLAGLAGMVLFRRGLVATIQGKAQPRA